MLGFYGTEKIHLLFSSDFILWTVFGLFVGLAMAIDIRLIREPMARIRRRESISKKQGMNSNKCGSAATFGHALMWTIIWISLAAIFAGIIYAIMGYEKTLEYITGYTLEKSLSVDNMFVFLLIFSSLGIPHAYQHRVLSVGIISAIAMRIPLIIAGVSLLETFHWMIYVFGGLLVLTAIRLLLQRKEKKIEVEKNIAVRLLKKVMPVYPELNQNHLFARINGILYATPMLVALVIVEMTDLVFAMDSIPAVLAVTSSTFIVITSNIFAIIGLRSLYFLLAGLMEKFYYLKPGLVALLLFIGSKMILSEHLKVPIIVSLLIIFGILGAALMMSVLKTRSLSKIQEHQHKQGSV